MRFERRKQQRGQILLMFTIGLVAMIGILALVVDIGIAYYQKKSAQKAADAASLAGAAQALFNVQNGTPQCGTNVPCQDSTPCPTSISLPTTDPISVACLYAQQNGFTGGSTNQSVSIAAGTTLPPPTAPGVTGIYYWMTVRVYQRNSILFGGVLSSDASSTRGIGETVASRFRGLPVALALSAAFGPASRASAGISDGILGGSLFLLNRQNDTWAIDNPGIDLTNGGNPVVTAPGGIYMSSIFNGSNNLNSSYAAQMNGTAAITSPHTYIRGAGWWTGNGSTTWITAPVNGNPDGPMFYDPMAGKGQPSPLPAAGLTNYVGVANGCLECMVQPLYPGQYYAVDSHGKPTGTQLIAKGDVTFSNGGTGFGNFVFYGGLSFPLTHVTVTFAPGRYVFAGTQAGNDIINYHTQVTLQDSGIAGTQNTDAGEIFIFTDPTYPGLAGHYPPALKATDLSSFVFGQIDLQAGNNPEVAINLHGLNVTSPNVPADLKAFAPTVMWQDQRNSRVKYTSAGQIDTTTCGSGHTLDNPCTNTALASSTTMGMYLQAHPNNSLYGMVYQPRGSWLTMQGNGNITSPTIFVTGALNLQGGADLKLINERDSLKKRIIVLIE